MTLTAEDATASEVGAAVPYLAVRGAREAIDWYVDIFGAELAGEPIVMPDGRIGHAELDLPSGKIFLADEHPDIGVAAPRPGEASVSLMLPVHDADAVRGRAITAGATGERPPYDGYGRRHAWIVDPFGHRWGLNSPLATATSDGHARAGDTMHVSMHAADLDRTRRFYSAVLGWTYLPDGRVAEANPSVGFRPGDSIMTCTIAVDDIADAVRRVRAGGGTATDPYQEPWAVVAECVDDQGTRFGLYEADGRAQPAPPSLGDLSYLTLEVVDSARARAFYGSVLGWRFTPGRIEDGWGVEGIAPMTGISGGHARATAVPMWNVADVAQAVELVRANGGTASEPSRQPYGWMSECTDDQGLRFYLGDG